MGLLQHPRRERPIIATSVGVIVPKIGVVWMFWLEATSVGTVLFAETEAGEYWEGYIEADGSGGFNIDCWGDSEQWRL